MDLPGDFSLPDFESGLHENLFYLGLCVVLIAGMAAANNLTTSGESVEVGYTHVYYECVGIDAGICLGVERPQHETFNYDDYEDAEEGTENYYRRVESELMLQAYNICEDQSLEGMDWLESAEYDNRTGDEWYEMEEVDLLGCEDTFRFKLNDSRP